MIPQNNFLKYFCIGVVVSLPFSNGVMTPKRLRTAGLNPLLHANNGFLGIYVHDPSWGQTVSSAKVIESDKWVHLVITWAAVDGEEGKLFYILLRKYMDIDLDICYFLFQVSIKNNFNA